MNLKCCIEARDVCYRCGEGVCFTHLRVPDPELFPDEEPHDYCLNCASELGFTEIWIVQWTNPQYGDGRRTTIDVPPGTHPFKIPGLAGLPPNWCNGWRKVTEIPVSW